MARRGLGGAALALLTLCALQPAALADTMTWTPCDAGLTAFTPDAVTLTPDPPVIGSPATFVVQGTVPTDLEGGSVELTVSFSGLPIWSQSADLCTKTQCPVPAGPIALTLVEALPPIAPPGDYGLQVVARAPDGSELACVNVNFSLVLPTASSSSKAGAAREQHLRVAAGAGEEAAGRVGGGDSLPRKTRMGARVAW